MSLNKTETKDLLNKTQIAYIATTRPSGRPHVAPIWFVLYKGKIYFETDKTTIKFANIKSSNRIAMTFGDRDSYTIEGKVKWWVEEKAPVPLRKLFWKKYSKDMDDGYITKNTYVFEVIVEKQMSWHYAPNWD